MSQRAYAQLDQGSHTVTVEVAPASAFVVFRSSVDLDIDLETYAPGQVAMYDTDESTIIAWVTNRRNQKLTIMTDLVSPSFTLKAQVIGLTAGVAMPEVILSTKGQDLIRSIGKTAGIARIRYTGVARPEEGSGVNEHYITYTLTSE